MEYERTDLDVNPSGNPLDFPHPSATPSVPPPPEFGLVLEAPPPRVTGAHPAVPSPTPSRRPWIIAAIVFALVAGGVGFVLGERFDEDPPTEATAARSLPVAAPPKAAPPPAAPKLTPAPAASDPRPCPDGMVAVEGGKFFMGTDRDVPVLMPAHPAHQVEVGAYCIDAREVTVDDYRRCSDRGECKRAHRSSAWPRPRDAKPDAWTRTLATYDELCNERYDDRGDHPVNCVTWEQAQRYCEWRGGRLPTEAEWEFAARGSDGRVYPWGDDAPGPEHMNGCGAECRTWRAAHGLPQTSRVLYAASDKYPGTAPVGSFPSGRTQWGLDDIAGNVFEWTADVYQAYPGAAASDDDRAGAERRVIRGGAFNSYVAEHADPALRFAQAADAHPHAIGFRCAHAVRR